MIIVKDITKRYARAVAVDQISFSVAKGQIVGFLGPNGAGKTTTMRILTCFLSPSAGTASVAGFDILEQPFEVKKRIGYLPETPPLYLEMETVEYLRFVGKLKGLSGAELEKRIDYVCDRCFVADVKNKLLGKLSKGYRQRVGLAQAIIHNPDVLILDEPTAGLDPKQINETRDLIKGLAGDHTIILSTHILPEVEQTCEQVLIINKGKLVATDSVRNLQARTRDAESLLLEVAGRDGQPDALLVQQKLEAIPGVSRVLPGDRKDSGLVFEVQSLKGQLVRGDLARAVVAAGWDLCELRPAGRSLEEIFLQLTGSEAVGRRKTSRERAATMRNTWTICAKELRSYFVSPIAYLLLTMFGLIFGFFFWNALGYFVIEGMEMQMRGQTFPMSINEQIIRPLLSNVSVVGLFFIPMISMRLFAEEKRSGTIELLATSPVRDIEVILGKWLAAVILYSCLLLFTALNFAFLFRYGHPDWKPLAVGYLGLLLQAGTLLALGTFISTLTKNQIIAGAATFASACCCGCWSGPAVMNRRPGRMCLPTSRSLPTSNPSPRA